MSGDPGLERLRLKLVEVQAEAGWTPDEIRGIELPPVDDPERGVPNRHKMYGGKALRMADGQLFSEWLKRGRANTNTPDREEQ